MKSPVIDGRRTSWLKPWGLLTALVLLAFLLLIGFAAEGGWGGDLLFDADGLWGRMAAPSADERETWSASQSMTGMPALLIALLASFSLIYFTRSRKMTIHRIKDLSRPARPDEKLAAIEELDRVKDPGVLLSLIDVAMDPQEDGDVRKAAAEAIQEAHALCPGLESAIANDDPGSIIELLIDCFEGRGKGQAQSAFAIGHQYMRLGRFAEAREWLQKARVRDGKLMLYGNRTDRLVHVCNDSLLQEGDALYAAGNYQGAREHYALLSQSLDNRQKRQYAIFLRSACVYWQLNDYRDADQALLLALSFDQETPKSLALINLLQRIRGHDAKIESAKEVPKAVRQAIDQCVAGVMDGLGATQGTGAATLAGSDRTALRY